MSEIICEDVDYTVRRRQLSFFGFLTAALQNMSVRRLSPTANLLRTSRLFALPPPLSRPSPDISAVSIFDSDTATTPYPTHAAIETTQSSLARGDWGLKRSLPLKSTTKTSTPIIHIENIDSIDHITDFGSAADHAITLRKWQQLDTPLSIPEKRKTASGALPPARSVFDSEFDNTEIINRRSPGTNKQRWKYKGPWLAGKTDGEFNNYMEKKVKRRKLDFRKYLREHLAQQKAAARRRQAVDEGEDLDNLHGDDVLVSEEDINTYIRHLRDNEQELHQLVQEYLDLPREEGRSMGGTPSQYDEKGPPTTHPSAGLSYLRTGSHIYNHPELGPQESKAPVRGRVVVPQRTRDRMNPHALIGLAGVVGKDKRVPFFKDVKQGDDDGTTGVSHYNPDIPGGAKLWTHPERASIDSHGKIDLVVDRANKNALNVNMGIYTDEYKPPPAAIAGATDRDAPDLAPSPPRQSARSLGYGLEGIEGAKRNERITPFLGPEDEAPNDVLDKLLKSSKWEPKI